MDYNALAARAIAHVQRVTAKFDEQTGGEALTEMLDAALRDAGIDIESKFGFETWTGAPDDVLVQLMTAFMDDPRIQEQNDAGVNRVIYDLQNALSNDNDHLQESHPELWDRVMDA